MSVSSHRANRLGIWLAVAMVFAVLMGPGPGLRLVNPNLDAADPVFTWFGMPVIYVWGLFWFAVQLTIVVIAYKTVWAEED